MRVVYLADAPYIHTRRWVEHFVAAGWDTHVVSFRPAEITGATVHHVDGFERIGKARYLVNANRVRRIVRELRPDILHAMHLTSYGFLAARCDVHPLLTSVWGTDILEAPDWTPLHNRLTRFALKRADLVTATGLSLAEATLRYMPEREQVTVVPFGVDLERFSPMPSTAHEELVVGTIGRLSMEKGLDILLKATALLARERPNMKVVIAGEGPERGKLERMAKSLGIEANVSFLGEIAYDHVPSTLATFDIFAMPSLAEGFGVAAIEAAAMGIPVVGSDVHGIPDVVDHDRTGLLVPPGDEHALAQAITRLAEDVQLRRSMGEQARAFVAERYDWKENAAQMERIYNDMVQAFTEDPARATVPRS
jgi:glycosyltransferase involved in cell wall biosynthesis